MCFVDLKNEKNRCFPNIKYKQNGKQYTRTDKEDK